jgi:hypothetical protein
MANQSDAIGIDDNIGDEALTATASIGISAALLQVAANFPRAQRAIITNGDTTIRCRYRYSGTTGNAPTASVGHVLGAGETIAIHGYNNLRRFRIIGESGSPVVYVSVEA